MFSLRFAIVSIVFTLSLNAFSQADVLQEDKIVFWLNNGDYQQVVDSLSNKLANDKKSFSVYYNLGIAHENLGNHYKALWCFENALKINPSSANAQHNAGYVLAKINPEIEWEHPFSLWIRTAIGFAVLWTPLFIVSVLILSALIFVRLTGKRLSRMNGLKHTLLIWMSLIIISLFAINTIATHYSEEHYAIVDTQDLQTYVSPNGIPFDNAPVLPTRIKVVKFNSDSSFVAIKLDNQLRWIQADQLLLY